MAQIPHGDDIGVMWDLMEQADKLDMIEERDPRPGRVGIADEIRAIAERLNGTEPIEASAG